MQVLVIGGGGREHTLVWKLAQSKKVTKLYAAPGNPGMKDLAECVDLDITDLDGLADWALESGTALIRSLRFRPARSGHVVGGPGQF